MFVIFGIIEIVFDDVELCILEECIFGGIEGLDVIDCFLYCCSWVFLFLDVVLVRLNKEFMVFGFGLLFFIFLCDGLMFLIDCLFIEFLFGRNLFI